MEEDGAGVSEAGVTTELADCATLDPTAEDLRVLVARVGCCVDKIPEVVANTSTVVVVTPEEDVLVAVAGKVSVLCVADIAFV